MAGTGTFLSLEGFTMAAAAREAARVLWPLVPGTNAVLAYEPDASRDSFSPWLDHAAALEDDRAVGGVERAARRASGVGHDQT